MALSIAAWTIVEWAGSAVVGELMRNGEWAAPAVVNKKLQDMLKDREEAGGSFGTWALCTCVLISNKFNDVKEHISNKFFMYLCHHGLLALQFDTKAKLKRDGQALQLLERDGHKSCNNELHKRRIKSWVRGQQLGAGSFGTIHEVISECQQTQENRIGHLLLALTDFGLAKQMTETNNLKAFKGSAYWMAPEQQAFFKIGRGQQPPIPTYLSREAQDFIMQCVTVNPDDRPSAAQLLEHPFVMIQSFFFL